jgi:hypothetical protein
MTIIKEFTEESLINELKEIAQRGWIENTRKGNSGSVGNMLEDLLGIEENNLPMPNAAEWELKAQRIHTSSLITLFHVEPSPRAMKLVPQHLLQNYGWAHQEANKRYSEKENSFRQTIHGNAPSDRGFMVKIDNVDRKIRVSFDYTKVAEKHNEWLKKVNTKIGLKELNPQPYWGFDDLASKAGTKLLNCFYVQADVKKENGKEYYWYGKVMMLQKFSFAGFLQELEEGRILIDFDARTGHNHGTKFRLRPNCLPNLYEKTTIII